MTAIKTKFAELLAQVTFAGDALPQIQRQEMERAFYAGWYSCLRDVTDDAAALSDEAAGEWLHKREQECETYFRTMGQMPASRGGVQHN